MERLNHILGRATPRRPYSAEQRSSAPQTRASQASSSSSAQSSNAAPTRRYLPEQTARQGQRYPYAPQPSSQQLSQQSSQAASRPVSRPGASRSPRQTRDLSRSAEYSELNRGSHVSDPYTRAAYPEPGPGRVDHGGQPRSSSSSIYRDRGARADFSGPENDAGLDEEPTPFRPIPARASANTGANSRSYYQSDRSIVNAQPQPQPRADALPSYGDLAGDYEDEDDEEEPGIYYDDWEADDDVVVEARPPQPVYRRGGSEQYLEMPELPARTPMPAYPRETPPPPYLSERTGGSGERANGSGRPTRDLRTQPPATALPRSVMPRSHGQDSRQPPRVTQPLNPRFVSDLSGREPEPVRPRPPALAGHNSITPLPPTTPIEQPAPSRLALPARRAVCPHCKGAGYVRENVPYGHPHFGKAIACECKEAERKEKRRQQLREISNLDAYRHQSFATFDARIPGVQEAYQAAQEFASEPSGWLLLMGPNGSGKTHLAIAIAQQALDSGSVVLFEPVPDLLDHLRAAFAPTSEEVYDQLFAKMREAEVLILDDLGAQQSSPWANEKLFQLLNYRYNMAMPTVITANSRVLSNIEERIRSRLSDTGLVVAVNMDRARDYRPRHPRRP